jgi:hypothetical protein
MTATETAPAPYVPFVKEEPPVRAARDPKTGKMMCGVRPLPRIGRTVLWSYDRNGERTPAIVMYHGNNGHLGVHVLSRGIVTLEPREGVPWAGDGTLRDEDIVSRGEGCWHFIDDAEE